MPRHTIPDARFDGGVDLEMRFEESEDRPRGGGAALVALHERGQLLGDAGEALLEAALGGERIALVGVIRLRCTGASRMT